MRIIVLMSGLEARSRRRALIGSLEMRRDFLLRMTVPVLFGPRRSVSFERVVKVVPLIHILVH